MMYRPFLHYVSPTCQTGKTDKRSFACAAACVSVARNVVHITSEMRKRNLLGGSYWFVMYITYFAILALVYFVLENPDSTTSKDILKDAKEGRETLASLAKKSMAADRCSTSLNVSQRERIRTDKGKLTHTEFVRSATRQAQRETFIVTINTKHFAKKTATNHRPCHISRKSCCPKKYRIEQFHNPASSLNPIGPS